VSVFFSCPDVFQGTDNNNNTAIIAYAASFFLLKYELVDAAIPSPTTVNASATQGTTPGLQQQAFAMPGSASPVPTAPSHPVNFDQNALPPSITLVRANPISALFLSLPRRTDKKRNAARISGPPTPPLAMLTRSHTLCIWLTALGFVLALVGVEAYCWTSLAQGTSIFVSVCLGLCFVGGAIVLR
jgi:hypothetical protein